MSTARPAIEPGHDAEAPVLISVVVPVYNRARYLAEALDRVQTQNYRPIEVIVVDDGSTDGSGDLARSYPETRVIDQPHGGVALARNAGVLAARGALVAFQDSDDLWAVNKLAVQAGFMFANPGVDFTLTRMRNFIDPGGNPPSWSRPELLNSTCLGIGPTLMVWRRVFDQVGLFDTRCAVGEDVDWVLRARDRGCTLSVVDEVLLCRRLHESNTTSDAGQCASEFLSLLRRSVRRKRAASTHPSGASSGAARLVVGESAET
jgi:glycosyltransferase involved in cell wall biosynthesis